MKVKANCLRLLSLSLLLILCGNSSVAQETLSIKNSSATYDVVVTVDKCDAERKTYSPNICSGPGRISIYRKGSATPFQILRLKNIDLDKEQTAYNPEVNQEPRKLYDDEYSLVLDDFNFDGNEDLAVCNGREGGYGGPSYNVYLYNLKTRRFVGNVRLSRLTEGYLGLFFVEPKKKQLIAYSKSGCCYHETEVYKVISNRPVLVERITEEASGTDTGYDVVITTKKFINGKWVKRVKKEKRKAENP